MCRYLRLFPSFFKTELHSRSDVVRVFSLYMYAVLGRFMYAKSCVCLDIYRSFYFLFRLFCIIICLLFHRVCFIYTCIPSKGCRILALHFTDFDSFQLFNLVRTIFFVCWMVIKGLLLVFFYMKNIKRRFCRFGAWTQRSFSTTEENGKGCAFFDLKWSNWEKNDMNIKTE